MVMTSPGCATCAAAEMVLKGVFNDPSFESFPAGDT
jgi:hypothetical protein